tara:strand:+ start:601 stop:774 length:174 start_codon:yes stop_codon:yes gene_type:complete
MLKTKFVIKDFGEWMYTYKNFNKKLLTFNDMHIDHVVKIKPYIGEEDFVIEIIINKK